MTAAYETDRGWECVSAGDGEVEDGDGQRWLMRESRMERRTEKNKGLGVREAGRDKVVGPRKQPAGSFGSLIAVPYLTNLCCDIL